MRKLTTEEFIQKAKEVHGDKYDYSKSVYKTKKEKVIITCPIHGDFEQSPDGHLRGQGCPRCKADKLSKDRSKSLEQFVEEANLVHNNKYNYSKFNYKNSKTKGIIICSIHGEFEQDPPNHLAGKGCPECGKLKISQKLTMSNKDFINHCQKLNPEYDYSITEYTGMANKIKYVCPFHGIIEQNAHDHYYNEVGCPKCNKSHGEKFIEQFLVENKIEYTDQYSIEIDSTINSSGHAKVDFYLPKYNTFIEYNGIQHYESVKHFGGGKIFQHQQKRDLALVDYCVKNSIQLIIIPYTIKTQEQIYSFLENCIDALKNSNLQNSAIIPIEYFYKLLESYHNNK